MYADRHRMVRRALPHTALMSVVAAIPANSHSAGDAARTGIAGAALTLRGLQTAAEWSDFFS
jgi:hypothetical protein